ncbi:MAG: DUF732 domain-containing protein [Mycobacteriaceae bacterium]
MAFFSSVLTRTSMLGVALAAVSVVALAGCSNSGSASAPSPTATVSATPVSSADSSAPAAPTTTEATTTEAPAAKPTSSPASQAANSPATNAPLDTKLYPAPDVPRSAGSTPKKAAYLNALQQGGLVVTASGATELTIGQAVCDELAKGGSTDNMKKLLIPLGSVAAGLGKSHLSGEQVAQLYIDSAKNNLC